MRPTRSARSGRRVVAVAGALAVSLPIAAGALTMPAAANAAADTASVVPASVHAHRLSYGRPVVLTGSLGAGEAGHWLGLEYKPAYGRLWQRLARTRVASDGRYRLSAPLRRTGTVRVVDLTVADIPVARAASTSRQAQRVVVAARLRVAPHSDASLGGGPVAVRGRMLPGLGGRIIRLQVGAGHGWRTVATTATGRGGAFTLRYTPGAGRQALRVRFGGDLDNADATSSAGTVAQYFANAASWYYDGAMTGCGFHATYGVANKSLPCGTHVHLLYGGRSVIATVDDRGPYVGGRTFDLNENTAAALGFAGVGTVWASY